ncbi:predicted protein [Sclerotinia sclerotiorum 1980 UF-70]|nr:predicted protein [Sclerotinia sclerotiorum 1980 UF-70]EDN93981.1 predicted protein [Sclerotinia sclerotiorum 1980 UF-70]
MCGRCLTKQGVHIDKDFLQEANARRRSEAAEIRQSTILTLKILEQANVFVKEEKRNNRERRRRRNTRGGMADRGKIGKQRKCVVM